MIFKACKISSVGDAGNFLDFFSAAELRVYENLNTKYKNRKSEWIAGRVAAKSAVANYLKDFRSIETPLKSIEIMSSSNGRPLCEAYPALSVSISHSGEYAVGAVSGSEEGSVGIDIERLRTFDESFLRNFLTKNEFDLASALPEEKASKFCTLLWSAKEAFLKAHGSGLREHPSAVETSVIHKNEKEGEIEFFYGGKRQNCSSWYHFTINNYVIVNVISHG